MTLRLLVRATLGQKFGCSLCLKAKMNLCRRSWPLCHVCSGIRHEVKAATMNH
jgi:hypothetical protein